MVLTILCSRTPGHLRRVPDLDIAGIFTEDALEKILGLLHGVCRSLKCRQMFRKLTEGEGIYSYLFRM